MHGDLEALVDDPCSFLWLVGTVAVLLIASPAVVGEFILSGLGQPLLAGR